jgi:hypothetical protein
MKNLIVLFLIGNLIGSKVARYRNGALLGEN